eukprot:4210519-Prymnesium_polylepis.1
MNVTSSKEQTNCTVFVLSVLRRLGAGGVVNLSGAAVEKHLKAAHVPEERAVEIASAWSFQWQQFAATPTYEGVGMQKHLKPMLSELTEIFMMRQPPSNKQGVKRTRGMNSRRGGDMVSSDEEEEAEESEGEEESGSDESGGSE